METARLQEAGGTEVKEGGAEQEVPTPPPSSSHLFLLIPVRTKEGGDGATKPGTPPHWAPPLRIRCWLVFSEPGPLATHHQPTFQLVRRATPSPGASPAGLLPRSRGPASQPRVGARVSPSWVPCGPSVERAHGDRHPRHTGCGHGAEDAEYLSWLRESKAHFAGGRAPS